jgi:two-component system chemotaxis response regulator CheB
MKKKVLIVDDSAVFAQMLKQIAGSVEGFEVCGEARDVFKATECIGRLKPDLLILDVEMPGMDGVHFLRSLLPQYAVPVIMCSSRRSYAVKALHAGAADFLIKPADYAKDFESFKSTLMQAMKNAMNLRSVCCCGKLYTLKRHSEAACANQNSRRVILIGGSAGSTEALPKILEHFGKNMPPVAAALHMPHGYTEMYAKRLNETMPIEVTEAKDGMRLKNGMAAIAQGSKHLRIYEDCEGFFLKVEAGERVSGHCPSVDVLFKSAAALDAKKIIAAILTGMGSDGAKGLLALRKAGAYTIGQDEKTSLVYGMPKAAHDIGAVCRQCGIDEIAQVIKSRLGEERQ